MKRFLSLLLVVLLLVTFLSACKDKCDDSANKASSTEEFEYTTEGEEDNVSAQSGNSSKIDVTVITPSEDTGSSNKEGESTASYDVSKSNSDCTHYDYKTIVKQELSCETDEIKTHICNLCYFTWEERKTAKGHTVVIDPAVAPTYKSTGLTEGSHCSDCGKVLVKQKTVSKLNKYETPELPA